MCFSYIVCCVVGQTHSYQNVSCLRISYFIFHSSRLWICKTKLGVLSATKPQCTVQHTHLYWLFNSREPYYDDKAILCITVIQFFAICTSRDIKVGLQNVCLCIISVICLNVSLKQLVGGLATNYGLENPSVGECEQTKMSFTCVCVRARACYILRTRICF